MQLLQGVADVVIKAVETAGASVVDVGRHGTGLVIGDGLVLTNAHNLRGSEAVLRFSDGREEVASIRGVDEDGDLAVLAAETAELQTVPWAAKEASQGQVIVALALAGGSTVRATVGTVSAVGRAFRGPRGRRIAGSFEHTAPLARGSSGGPVLDEDGAVLGVNTHRVDTGFYLAVPVSSDLRRRVDQLATGSVPSSRRLGAAIAAPEATRHLRDAAGLPEVDGLLVRAVEEGGAADRAGLRRGDVLVEAGGNLLSSVDDLYSALDTGAATIAFRVARATEKLTVEVSFE